MSLCVRFYEGMDWEYQTVVDMSRKNSFLEASADDLNNIFERLAAVSQLKGVRNKARRVEARSVEETPEPYVTEWEKEIRSHI